MNDFLKILQIDNILSFVILFLFRSFTAIFIIHATYIDDYLTDSLISRPYIRNSRERVKRMFSMIAGATRTKAFIVAEKQHVIDSIQQIRF